ncbi:Hypothetical predicted protein [Mytilus galloprovincialis]|uniref:Uncharacterized protein n=1 Tax=Mytilus galloprovincialis TaxID=29158 RepID=A0A8B6FJG4_MYTGA|nr:Hypothetical predicted protein [Mytilus galloprovincialis]
MAKALSYKNPTSLTNEKSYQQWKNEVKMWQLVTELDKKKRGLALALSLQGKPREVELEITPEDLNVDEGSDNDIVTVKEESAFVGEHRFDRGRSSRRSGARSHMNRSFDQRNTQSRLNPTINGRISRCRCCDSKYHWFRDCPHKTYDVKLTEEQTDTSETVNITLITTSQQNITPQEIFVAEAFNAAVEDTACTKTVCGTKWLHQFLDTFDSANEEIKCKESNTPFKFGDGKTVHSYQSVKLPATIGSLKCYIETDVVDCEIPLLLTKDSLKRAQTVLDLHNDKVTMFGKPVDVHFTSNGHYCINIKDRRTGQTDSVVS